MTKQELNALLSIIQRAPMTPAEALALEIILNRLAAEVTETPANATDRH